jgi:SAM-dependent methyltransferase
MYCRICGNTQIKSVFLAKEMMYGLNEEFDYFQCSNCECLQIASFPDDMSAYYPKNYYSFSVNESSKSWRDIVPRLRNYYAVTGEGLAGRMLYAARPNPNLKLLRNAKLKPESRILDVGCGSGKLLRTLNDSGFKNLLGIDPFLAQDIDFGNGLKILKSSLADVEGKWDLIMFNHSFEHMPQQLACLQAVKALLKEGGTCLIRIPVVSSFAWRHYGTNWVQLDAPRHFFLHSVRSMNLLAEKGGLSVKDIVFDSDAFQFWGSEQYVKGITLLSERSFARNPGRSVFSQMDIKTYAQRAEKLNAANDGDQAAFYLTL